HGDELARTRAARNLGASGFAPGITWMERLLRESGDRAVREGLLTAASTGRSVPALLATPTFEQLWSELESVGGERSARILCALSHCGCVAADGALLAPRVLAGFDAASAGGRWARF